MRLVIARNRTHSPADDPSVWTPTLNRCSLLPDLRLNRNVVPRNVLHAAIILIAQSR
jgi:hypothetical protein